MKYNVTIHYTDTVEAESADEAVNAVFEDLDSQSNMSLTTTLCHYHTTVTPVNECEDCKKSLENHNMKCEKHYDANEDDIEASGKCPHCDVPLVSKMIDVDGTNLEEHEVCPDCGYGTPALR